MKELLYLFLLVICQNASFTLVSRARNSKSILYHTLAAIGSNGTWLLVFREMVTEVGSPASMITYLVASVIGSILMHYVAMRFFEKPKKKRVEFEDEEIYILKTLAERQRDDIKRLHIIRDGSKIVKF